MSENGTNNTVEFSSQEKSASVAWRLSQGDEVTTRQVADEFGMTWHGAHKMLCTVSRVIPISLTSTGTWRRFDAT